MLHFTIPCFSLSFSSFILYNKELRETGNQGQIEREREERHARRIETEVLAAHRAHAEPPGTPLGDNLATVTTPARWPATQPAEPMHQKEAA